MKIWNDLKKTAMNPSLWDATKTTKWWDEFRGDLGKEIGKITGVPLKRVLRMRKQLEDITEWPVIALIEAAMDAVWDAKVKPSEPAGMLWFLSERIGREVLHGKYEVWASFWVKVDFPTLTQGIGKPMPSLEPKPQSPEVQKALAEIRRSR